MKAICSPISSRRHEDTEWTMVSIVSSPAVVTGSYDDLAGDVLSELANKYLRVSLFNS